MKKDSSIILFHQKQVRRHWDEKNELWFFSIIDVIEVLTGNTRPRKYWNDLKKKLLLEGSQLSENIGQLKMQSSDGKFIAAYSINSLTKSRTIQVMVGKNGKQKTKKRSKRFIKNNYDKD